MVQRGGQRGQLGALGGVAVNLALRQSFLDRGTGDAAYAIFVAFFLVCLAVTWSTYLRPGHGLEGV